MNLTICSIQAEASACVIWLLVIMPFLSSISSMI
jgi:hypothetical protein